MVLHIKYVSAVRIHEPTRTIPDPVQLDENRTLNQIQTRRSIPTEPNPGTKKKFRQHVTYVAILPPFEEPGMVVRDEGNGAGKENRSRIR
jgi:hypothetical protein